MGLLFDLLFVVYTSLQGVGGVRFRVVLVLGGRVWFRVVW